MGQPRLALDEETHPARFLIVYELVEELGNDNRRAIIIEAKKSASREDMVRKG